MKRKNLIIIIAACVLIVTGVLLYIINSKPKSTEQPKSNQTIAVVDGAVKGFADISQNAANVYLAQSSSTPLDTWHNQLGKYFAPDSPILAKGQSLLTSTIMKTTATISAISPSSEGGDSDVVMVDVTVRITATDTTGKNFPSYQKFWLTLEKVDDKFMAYNIGEY